MFTKAQETKERRHVPAADGDGRSKVTNLTRILPRHWSSTLLAENAR